MDPIRSQEADMTHNGVKAREIRQAQARHRRALDAAEATRNQRDETIRAAIAAGWSHAQVYRELDGAITRARIGQIALGGR
jgi:hypothetical protein